MRRQYTGMIDTANIAHRSQLYSFTLSPLSCHIKGHTTLASAIRDPGLFRSWRPDTLHCFFYFASQVAKEILRAISQAIYLEARSDLSGVAPTCSIQT
jgi:hypothetical protein